VAQENNHGVSEASALLLAGSWLKATSDDEQLVNLGAACFKRGKRVLERSVEGLVLEDGGFSMSSFAYHRVVLDTLSVVEFWRKTLNLPMFSSSYYRKASLLVDFLYQVHDSQSGDVPNVGANDGSRSYLLTCSDYRDFRPSLHLASSYFSDSKAFNCDGLDSWALLRFPSFRFRPAQSDALHFDLWWQGRNILTDSGSYSYNCSKEVDDYFSGAAGHNVVQFADIESMPRIGKFLWGEWLKADGVASIDLWAKEQRWQSSFTDYLGGKHTRRVTLEPEKWLISDEVSGFSTAKLRWHLEDRPWRLKGNVLESGDIRIEVRSLSLLSLRLCNGWKSLYYNQRVKVPVLEISFESDPINIFTEIKLIH
jgi:hypothetical protein